MSTFLKLIPALLSAAPLLMAPFSGDISGFMADNPKVVAMLYALNTLIATFVKPPLASK